jgi:hypothetical protein
MIGQKEVVDYPDKFILWIINIVNTSFKFIYISSIIIKSSKYIFFRLLLFKYFKYNKKT